MSLGFGEILLIVVVILFVFGGKRIPELAKAFGRATHEYKKAKNEIQRESSELMTTLEQHAEAAEKSETTKKTPEPSA